MGVVATLVYATRQRLLGMAAPSYRETVDGYGTYQAVIDGYGCLSSTGWVELIRNLPGNG